MEIMLPRLGPNKVVLDIKSNNFEEIYEYPTEKFEKFEKIECIQSMYRNISDVIKPPPPPPPKKVVISETINDKFIYCVLMNVDHTITLVPDKNDFITSFKESLLNKIENYVHKFKKYGFSKNEVITAINGTDARQPLYYYTGILLNKSVALKSEDAFNLFEIYGSEINNCIIVNEKELTCEDVTLKTCKEKISEFYKTMHLQRNTLEKLNALLVKDLKELAEQLGLETTKVSDGKKKNLLKADLKDIIKARLES